MFTIDKDPKPPVKTEPAMEQHRLVTLSSMVIITLLLLAVPCANSAYGQGRKLDLSKAVIVHSSARPRHAAAAQFLQHELEIRTGIKLTASGSTSGGGSPAIVIGTVANSPTPFKLPHGLSVPAKAEGYAIWIEQEPTRPPRVYLIGSDDRGALFAAGRLIRLLYLAPHYIHLPDDLRIATAPADTIRAQQIIRSTQSEDRFIDWDNAEYKQQHIRDLVMFGTNGFEPKAPENVDDLLEHLGIDFFHKLTCQKIIDYDELTDNEIKQQYTDLVGIDHITTYGGDANGSRPPTGVFPKAERVLPLIIEGLGGRVKWWYSNQCLDDHAVDYDEYIFNYFKTRRPSWLYGMVYGPWTKRGIREIRADLPAQYLIRHYPESCHVRWCQYPVPKWDRVWAAIWPRNQSIYLVPSMVLKIHRATRAGTEGFLPYNHTGTYNDLNKFAWVCAGWDPHVNVADVLHDYARVFFAYDFKQHPAADDMPVPKDIIIDAATNAVARGLTLLEQNWSGPLADNTSTEPALKQWKQIAKCMGGVGKNWRLELFLYKAFLDAQVKRKYDTEMKYERQAYEALKRAKKTGLAKAVKNARNALAKTDTQFQSNTDFIQELQSWGLTDSFGDLNDVLNNIYTPLSDRKWLEAQLETVTTHEDLKKIINYEDPGPGGFYDNLGDPGRQPHLVRQKTWDQDPGFVYSPIEWVDSDPGSDRRHSQLTHAVCRYDTPLLMRWQQLDPAATYHIKVVYRGPFDPQFTCKTDDGRLIHGVRGNTQALPAEYPIPPAATRDGVLELRWQLENQVRGVSVTEIWLIKN
ncbi:MAG: beta-N-acetylhexosaminidase family protein [Planctomycetota bacterium]|jgi:hypothetical protein